MGFRFRKSINIAGGALRVNLSKSGVGYSVGGKGARITKKANGGTRYTAFIPGTGISYVQETGKKKAKSQKVRLDDGREVEVIIETTNAIHAEPKPRKPRAKVVWMIIGCAVLAPIATILAPIGAGIGIYFLVKKRKQIKAKIVGLFQKVKGFVVGTTNKVCQFVKNVFKKGE